MEGRGNWPRGFKINLRQPRWYSSTGYEGHISDLPLRGLIAVIEVKSLGAAY